MKEISARQIGILAGAASAALLIAALAFQYAGFRPCHLCILQRWPHLAAAVIGLALIFTDHKALRLLGLVAAVVALALAAYHTGVEYHWWAGPADCTGAITGLGEMATEDLMAQIMAAPVVRCDEPALRILGLSMAGWNALASAVLVVMWARAARGRAVAL